MPEMSFTMDEEKTVPKNYKLLKIVADHDLNTFTYSAKQPLPDYFYSLNYKERNNYCIQNRVFDFGGGNLSGWKTISKIYFMENSLPFEILKIDTVESSWGGKQILLNIKDTGLVHLRVIAGGDTFTTPLLFAGDTVIVKPECHLNSTTTKKPYLNIFEWLGFYIYNLVKRHSKK